MYNEIFRDFPVSRNPPKNLYTQLALLEALSTKIFSLRLKWPAELHHRRRQGGTDQHNDLGTTPSRGSVTQQASFSPRHQRFWEQIFPFTHGVVEVPTLPYVWPVIKCVSRFFLTSCTELPSNFSGSKAIENSFINTPCKKQKQVQKGMKQQRAQKGFPFSSVVSLIFEPKQRLPDFQAEAPQCRAQAPDIPGRSRKAN